MSVLLLRLAGPLQSWGVTSRFVRRTTEAAPTKSGIIGLLAAAQGRRRNDPIEDLVGLRLAVRTDQQGELLRDFHTAHHLVSGDSMPLSERFYWADAVFVAGIEAEQQVVAGLADALADPAFPIYLGRRSCVPAGRVILGVEQDHDLETVMRTTPWQAGSVHRRRLRRQKLVPLTVQADAGVLDGVAPSRRLQDVPFSFSPEGRQYGTREVAEVVVDVVNPEFVEPPSAHHDPIQAAREAS